MKRRKRHRSGAATLTALLILFISAANLHAADEPAIDDSDVSGVIGDGGADDGAPTPAPPAKPSRPGKPAKPRKPERPGRMPPPRDSTKPPAASEADSEAVGPDADEHCRSCGKPAHADPGPQTLVDAFTHIRGKYDLLELTGTRMSCAQRKYLESAKYVNEHKYGSVVRGRRVPRAFSLGDCGGGVGTITLAAGIPFEPGPPRGPTRFAKDYMKFCPKHGFLATRAKSVDEAPDGSTLVFGGINTPGVDRSQFDPRCFKPRKLSPGDNVGHVTIKGSPSMDDGNQWYYTDGRTVEPAVRCRVFMGAFLPPGSDKGPAPTDGKGHFKCD